MRHISTTPFGRRPVTAGLLAHQAMAEAPASVEPADKWQILRDLTEARAAFGVSDRDLAVLTALISFHPEKMLQDDGQLIVFPSNASLASRAHGMAESTLRRHLATLVRAGLILRHDSPNGKRYALRANRGAIATAFGFDLRPLLLRAAAISHAAAEARAQTRQMQALRQDVVLLTRDCAKLLLWAKENGLPATSEAATRLADLQRCLRRKLDLSTLAELHRIAEFLREELLAASTVKTEELHGNDSQNERHNQSSDSYLQESESGNEDQIKASASPHTDDLTLNMVLQAAPEITVYASQPINSWQDLTRMADLLSPMLGIDARTWRSACHSMGTGPAAVTLACILQRNTQIRRPPAYLQSLTAKAMEGTFSPAPMVRALLNARQVSLAA